MEHKEEMRKDDVNDFAENDYKDETQIDKFDLKATIIVIIMMLLMIYGAICIVWLPLECYQNSQLKSELVATREETYVVSEYQKEFVNYLDNLDVSKGLSIEEIENFEIKYSKYRTGQVIAEESSVIYIEQKVIEKLEEAFNSTMDANLEQMLTVILEQHRENLANSQDSLKEVEDIYLDVKNKDDLSQ